MQKFKQRRVREIEEKKKDGKQETSDPADEMQYFTRNSGNI